jgi:EAL domain-containing protein (putative c-di-GMP-specific phosphodiesterase class I)
MNDPDKAISIMRALRATGFTLSIDDFGTGYSSLGRLKSFPIHSLKIDRTFVKGLPDDQDDVAIARGVIALAHSLRLSVVAEGVETAEQFEFLRSVGCDEIQGYLISRPLPAGQAMAVVEQGPGLRLISSGEP